jgi:hypothetical protein
VWSADGRRVQFELWDDAAGFGWREVDADTGELGEITKARPGAPPAPKLPEGAGDARFSPARRWYAYRGAYGLLYVSRADGSELYPIKLGFDYYSDGAAWSPCGTKIATGLTAGDHTGVYVLDLRTGQHRRVSPRGSDPYTEPNYFVSGWSPDGAWLAVTKNRWHDPKACDYELNELWLLAADGSAARQITDDGVCMHPAIRPTAEPAPANGEHELTFDWAEGVKKTHEEPAGVALAAQVRVDLEAGPPFVILLMVRTPEGHAYPEVPDCESIPDGFEKLDSFLKENNIQPDPDFVVVFPQHGADPTLAVTERHVSELVFQEAMKRGWRFDREVPRAPEE